jgi:septal ring factor EnvC (AmiA/AmiB activator)
VADPDNLILSHLRDIRSDIAQMTNKLDHHARQFDKLEDRLAPNETKLLNALRFATMANLGAQNAEARVLEVAERQKRLEQRLEDFDTRLALIEQSNSTR